MDPVVDIYVPPRGTLQDRGDRHYCPRVSDVEYVHAAHGCETASFTVLDPAAAARLTEDCQVWISDPHSGEVVWTGNIARDGLKRGPLGQSAVVRCVGNVGDLHSSYWSLPYVVTDYQAWEREAIKYGSHDNFDTSISSRPSLKFSVNDNGRCYPGMQARMAYMGHLGSSMRIGGFRGRFLASLDRPLWRQRLHVGDAFWGNTPIDIPWQSTAQTLTRAAGGTSWPMPPKPSVSDPAADLENYLVLTSLWDPPAGTSGTVTELAYVSSVYDDNVLGPLAVLGQRVDRWGENIPTNVNAGVTAPDIAEDIVGRCLSGIVDPGRCAIVAEPLTIDVADWRDPVTPGEVLDDLTAFHPDYLWRIGLRSPTSGLAPFEWRPWESAPRYLIDADTSLIDLDGAPDGLYNRVTLRWTDSRGRTRSRSYTASPDQYPDIASLDGWREPPPLDLDQVIGGASSAAKIASAWLSQVAVRRPSGQITVHEPVLDLVSQTRVPPSQLEAGTTLALTSDEPTRTHRVLQVTHRGTSEATLTVGAPGLDLDLIVRRLTGGRKR